MSHPKEIRSCEVCGNERLEPVLDLGLHPLCDDLIAIGSVAESVQYPIEILYCTRCATAHQRFQVPKRELFPETYHYRSRFTADVLQGMKALVDSCEERIGAMSGKVVLDVGCNDGSLLDFFRTKGCVAVGIEPTGAFSEALAKGHAVYNDFFTVESAREIQTRHGSPDIITFTNVFAHIENLGEVLDALRELISGSTIIVVENHYLGAVLDRYQFDTFYHEHPRTYSLSSFREIARSLGMALSGVEFPSRYGGNIRVFMGGVERGADPDLEKVAQGEAAYLERFGALRHGIEWWQSTMRNRIDGLATRHGPLCAKAFPGRAAILVKLLGLDTQSVRAVYEKPGSMKIGHYLPGTRIPIRSDLELFSLAEKPPVLLNFAWHISNEIKAYLAANRYEGQVVDILDPRELAAQA